MEAAEEQEGIPTPRSDLVSGGIWMVIGFAVIVGSWNMDRLDKQGVPDFAAPGLVPGILGVLMLLAALAIVIRSVRQGALVPAAPSSAASPARLVVTLVLCLGFAVVLVGHGLPFWLASTLYLFLHIALLQFRERRAAGQMSRGIAVAAIIALVAGVSIAVLFQYVFLVRLP